MNAKVHPLVVVLVIFLTFIAIGVWVWGSGESKKIGGPAGLTIDPDGHLYVQIQNQLLEHDAEGVFLKRHDLADLGVESLLGGTAFFANGDILLRRGTDSRTLWQNIRAYQRLTNDQSLTPQALETGLYRCSLDTRSCQLFGSEAVDFKAAYGVFIDWRNDDVYITDTTRHLLRKYSSSGESLAAPAEGFVFPNQVTMHEGHLYVVNTNQHQVRKVDSDTATFGQELATFDVNPPVAIEARRMWPSHVARVGDEWWVNNMSNNMSEGAIYVFDDEWRYDRKVALPIGADPIALLPFLDEILISDWNNDRVYRVSQEGQLLRDLESPGLDEWLTESRAKRLQFEIYSYAGIALFIFVIAGLFVRAMTTNESIDPDKNVAQENARTLSMPDEMLWLEPDPKTVRKNRISMRIAVVLIIVASLSLALFTVFSAQGQAGLVLIPAVGGLVAISLMIGWIGRVNFGTAIGLHGKTVTLRDYKGRESSCPVRDVIYDHTAIATGDMAVFLGQPQMQIYAQELLQEQLFPRLGEAQRVSIWKMQTTLMRQRHPQGLIALLVVLGLAVGAIWMVLQPDQ